MIRESFHNIQQKACLCGGSFMSTSYLVQSCCLKSSLFSRCPELDSGYHAAYPLEAVAETTRFSLDGRRFPCKWLPCKRLDWERFPYKWFQSRSKSQADLKRQHSSNSEFILLIETNEKLISLSSRLWILESGIQTLEAISVFVQFASSVNLNEGLFWIDLNSTLVSCLI